MRTSMRRLCSADSKVVELSVGPLAGFAKRFYYQRQSSA
jgi:hypothetical protein